MRFFGSNWKMRSSKSAKLLGQLHHSIVVTSLLYDLAYFPLDDFSRIDQICLFIVSKHSGVIWILSKESQFFRTSYRLPKALLTTTAAELQDPFKHGPRIVSADIQAVLQEV